MSMRRFDPRQQQRGPQIRINQRIRVPEVRVIGDDGEMLGILPTHEALKRAQERGLDLVEVNPKADPPVCKILDYGKFKYDEKKKARETRIKTAAFETKEIKLRPKTDDHDLDFKTRAAHAFLEAGHKVKFTVRFRGREITHPQVAQSQLDRIMSKLEEVATIEVRPTMDQRTMMLLIAPKAALLQKVQQARAAAAKALRKDRGEGSEEAEQRKRDEEIAKIEQQLAEADDDDDDDDDDEGEGEGEAKGA
ncbi:MAG: translation initiation factor IF-3 [Polyangiaceae bacterium]|jgi:translation initiation factor IF-3|nr:translation initiation factor IF-3 [Polyangiaceae bacterium]